MDLPWEEKKKKVKKRKKKLSESNYCIPSPLAKMMEKVDMRTQYEASLLSMAFILVGLLLSTVYMTFFVTGLQTWYKVTLIINMIAGFVFLSSFLVTTFQQYKSYLKAREFQEEMKGGSNGKIQKEIRA